MNDEVMYSFRNFHYKIKIKNDVDHFARYSDNLKIENVLRGVKKWERKRRIYWEKCQCRRIGDALKSPIIWTMAALIAFSAVWVGVNAFFWPECLRRTEGKPILPTAKQSSTTEVTGKNEKHIWFKQSCYVMGLKWDFEAYTAAFTSGWPNSSLLIER